MNRNVAIIFKIKEALFQLISFDAFLLRNELRNPLVSKAKVECLQALVYFIVVGPKPVCERRRNI